MRTAIYSRKSRLSETGESIQNQILMCQEYAKSHFQVDESKITIYEDEGFSGKNTDRPAFTRLMNEVKASKIDTVICYRLDRISRNVVDFSSTLDLLTENNVAFVSITEHFDTSTPIGRAMIYISSVFSQLERETIAERIRHNKLKLARTGRWLGGIAPLGYKSEQLTYTDERGATKKQSRLVLDMQNAKKLDFLFNKYLEIQSISGLYLYLLKENIVSENGNPYSMRALSIILQNPTYVKADEKVYDYFLGLGCDVAVDKRKFDGNNGVLVFNRLDKHTSSKKIYINDHIYWVVSIGLHKGIIDSEKWLMVQKLIKINSAKFPRDGTSKVGLLTSLVKCSKCNSNMTVAHKKNAKGETLHYYRCRNKIETKGYACNNPNIIGISADKEVIDILLKYVDIDRNDLIIDYSKRKQSDNINTRSIMDVEKEIEEIRRKISVLISQLSVNTTMSKYVSEEIEKFDKQISQKTMEIKKLNFAKQESNIKDMNNDMFFNKLIEFKNNLNELDFEEKKKFVHLLIKTIHWDGSKMDIQLNLM